MIETLVLIFVAWNAVLQTGWFIWSYNVSKRKHFVDEKEWEDFQLEKEIAETERDFLKEELKRHQNWSEFKPVENNFKKNENGKYNPDEIPGMFDTLFKDENE